MGSSNEWERALKLTGSAIELVAQKARSVEALADHLQQFAGSEHLVVLSEQYQRATRLLFFALQHATQDGQIELWADHLQRFVFGPRVAVIDAVIRHVKDIDRTLTPQQVLDATGRKQHTDPGVIASMPREGRTEDDVFFIPLRRFTSPQKVAETLELHGLKPDPYAQAKVNTDDSAFADEHPNASQWQGADGSWCYAAFDRWDGGRSVDVSRGGHGWDASWWVAGVRK